MRATKSHAGEILAIQALVARKCGQELDMASREHVDTFFRQIAIYLARQETRASLTEIGNLFGGKHHTTVLHAVKAIEERRRRDSELDLLICMLSRDVR